MFGFVIVKGLETVTRRSENPVQIMNTHLRGRNTADREDNQVIFTDQKKRQFFMPEDVS
jgi:hypothetical protein